MPSSYSKITPEIEKLASLTKEASYVKPELYTEYGVKRGLRDLNGKGVLVGITNISEVNSQRVIDGKNVPIPGELYYRGINVSDIVKNIKPDNHFGFEEITYLLLFGELPTRDQLRDFIKLLSSYRSLPKNFVRDSILKKPSSDMMNSLARSVLALYSYDDNPDDISEANVLRQCLQLIAMFPLLSVYGYQAYRYYDKGDSLIIHRPKKEYSTAENILHCLRDDSSFTPLEAKLLDVALILHAEHGLKGPRHGGANIKVVKMFADMKKHVKDWTDEEEAGNYLRALLHKEAFDHAGLIYGIGHAVYSISDPRAVIFQGYVEQLAEAKGYEKGSLRRLFQKRERCTRESALMSISSVDSYIRCSVCLWSFSHLYLRSPVSQAGRLTGWRRSATTTRS